LCNRLHDLSHLGRLIKARLLPYSKGMQNTQDRLTQALDEALELTFPASDPIAVTPMKETDHEAANQ